MWVEANVPFVGHLAIASASVLILKVQSTGSLSPYLQSETDTRKPGDVFNK